MWLWLEPAQPTHLLSTVGAGRLGERLGRCYRFGLWVGGGFERGLRDQYQPDLMEQMALCGAKQAVVSDLDKTFGQDVLQKTADKLIHS